VTARQASRGDMCVGVIAFLELVRFTMNHFNERPSLPSLWKEETLLSSLRPKAKRRDASSLGKAGHARGHCDRRYVAL